MKEGNNTNNTNNANNTNMSSNSTPLNPAEAAAQALTAASDTADGTSAGGSAGAGGGIGGNAAGGSDGGRTGGNGSGRKKWLISAGAAAAVAVVGGGVMLSHQADPKDTVIDAFKSITAEGQLNPSEEIFGTKELEKLLQKGSAQTGMELSMTGISDESLNQMSGAGIGLDVKRDVDSSLAIDDIFFGSPIPIASITCISLFVMSLNSGVMITFCSMSITSRNSVTRSSFSVS